MKRVILDSSGDVYRILPVADTFTLDDLEAVREKASRHSHDANLYAVPECAFCVGEIQHVIAEYNGEEEPEKPGARRRLGQMLPCRMGPGVYWRQLRRRRKYCLYPIQATGG
jgi:hypothetical protein